MDLRHLKTLIAIAEHGSFAAAGDAIGLTQSAVSLHVKALEEDLETKLFDRTTRRVVITDAGQRLRGRVERMVVDMRNLVREFRDEAHLGRGRVVVGASPSVAAAFLPKVIAEFQRRRPGIEVVLVDDFFGQVLDRVTRGEVDLAVTPVVPGRARSPPDVGSHDHPSEP